MMLICFLPWTEDFELALPVPPGFFPREPPVGSGSGPRQELDEEAPLFPLPLHVPWPLPFRPVGVVL